MSFWMLSLLAIVQGITEFLPISSSAHLILIHAATGEGTDALALDVAVHLGSIVAVVIYLRAEVARVLAGVGDLVTGRGDSARALSVGHLVVATIPALVLGLVLALTGWVERLRDPLVIGVTMIVFGIWLWWAHRTSPEDRALDQWTRADALRLGLWQAVALIPGVSRSGITMTAARLAGFERHSAARLSMLLSIPVTLATGGYLGIKVLRDGIPAALWGDIALAAGLAFVFAYGALVVMMHFLGRVSFTPYVVYRALLGAVLLVVMI